MDIDNLDLNFLVESLHDLDEAIDWIPDSWEHNNPGGLGGLGLWAFRYFDGEGWTERKRRYSQGYDNPNWYNDQIRYWNQPPWPIQDGIPVLPLGIEGTIVNVFGQEVPVYQYGNPPYNYWYQNPTGGPPAYLPFPPQPSPGGTPSDYGLPEPGDEGYPGSEDIPDGNEPGVTPSDGWQPSQVKPGGGWGGPDDNWSDDPTETPGLEWWQVDPRSDPGWGPADEFGHEPRTTARP